MLLIDEVIEAGPIDLQRLVQVLLVRIVVLNFDVQIHLAVRVHFFGHLLFLVYLVDLLRKVETGFTVICRIRGLRLLEFVHR